MVGMVWLIGWARGKGEFLVRNLVGQIQFLSGKISFCRANKLTPPHSKTLRYGPEGRRLAESAERYYIGDRRFIGEQKDIILVELLEESMR